MGGHYAVVIAAFAFSSAGSWHCNATSRSSRAVG